MLKLARLQLPTSFYRIATRSKSSKEKSQEESGSCTKEKNKQPNKEPDYVVLRATKDDFDCILDLMHESYYPNEPTCASLNFKPTRTFDEETIKAMSEGITLMAKCKYSGDLVAASVNETTNPWDPDTKEKLACNIACEKSRHLLRFYAYMQRKPELWRKYRVQKIFEIAYVFVRSDQRGKNLALNIMEESRTLAADCGYTLIRVDCTSEYSAKICEKMGMHLVQKIPYNTYLNQDNEPIFKPPEPHTDLKTYIDNNPQINYKKKPLPLMVIPKDKPKEKPKKKTKS